MVFPNLDNCPIVAMDTETFGVDRFAKIFGFSVATPDYQAWYFDVRQEPKSLEWLQHVVNVVPKIVNHNAAFDIRVLHNSGINTDAKKWECTMVRACLINEHMLGYSLEDCARYAKLDVNKDHDIYEELSRLFGGQPTRNAQIDRFPKCPVEVMEKYAKLDVIVAMKLWQWQEQEIERQNLHKIWGLEKRLMPFIVQQEEHGIRIDEDRAHRVSCELETQYTKLLYEIEQEVGKCNINSSDQLYKAFGVKRVRDDGSFINDSDFNAAITTAKETGNLKNYLDGWKYVARDGTVLPKTASGKCSITAEQLKAMKDPIARKIWKTKKLMKAKSTFVDGHILSNAIKGYVYPNINQNRGDTGDGMEGTRTGRLSYSRPAMQQIPSRDKEMASIIRPIFLPDEHQGWTYGDLDQHEYRVFAHFANSPAMIEKYRENPDLDLHQAVADLTGLPRSANPETGGANAKQCNLGMVFCLSGDTEYLTPTGWKRIDEYDGGLVGQYVPETGKVEFVKPTQYVVNPCGEMWKVSNFMKVTPDHRIPYNVSAGGGRRNFRVKSAREFVQLKKGAFSLITKWDEDRSGCDLKDDEIRLIVMMQADGHIRKDKRRFYGNCQMHFSKQRKIDRCVEILKNLNMKYNLYKCKNGTTEIYFEYADASKSFPEKLYNMDNRQKKLFIEELVQWDGSLVSKIKRYYTGNRQCADFVQLIASSMGFRTDIVSYQTKSGNMYYRCDIGRIHEKSLKPTYERIENQKSYCFSVPSTFFVVRQSNICFVTGNCMGAGHLCQIMGLPYTMAKAKFDGVEREYAVAGEEGRALLESYYKMVPGVREVARQATSIAKERGYVRTIMGRHIRFPGGKETHKASGLIYQGSAADFNKLNICLICEYLEQNCPDAHLLLNIHDEYNISMPYEDAEKHIKAIQHIVEYKPMLRVPIRTDFSMLAENWYLANVADHLTHGWSCMLDDLKKG